MTVKELIAALTEHDPESNVYMALLSRVEHGTESPVEGVCSRSQLDEINEQSEGNGKDVMILQGVPSVGSWTDLVAAARKGD